MVRPNSGLGMRRMSNGRISVARLTRLANSAAVILPIFLQLQSAEWTEGERQEDERKRLTLLEDSCSYTQDAML